MKYKSYVTVLLAALLLNTSTAAFSKNAVQRAVERKAIAAQEQAKRIAQATVSIKAQLTKPIKMSDVMCRHPRCKDQIVAYDTTEHVCQGVLAQGGERVFVPANCVTKDGYTLGSVRLQFSNGVIATGSKNTVATQGDLSYIRVTANTTQGLQGLPVSQTPPGMSLVEHFGERMENLLLDFFHFRGVPAKAPRCRIGAIRRAHVSTVKIGEPVIYAGKVVALVKDIPHTFSRGFFGGVSEKNLAIIR